MLSDNATDDDLRSLMDEFLILKHLNDPDSHKNVLQLIGVAMQGTEKTVLIVK